ncbi:MAG: response regulator [Deltaproteobacteria bacterium]|nr:response regulator [Deltaproteobacteria bacterium]
MSFRVLFVEDDLSFKKLAEIKLRSIFSTIEVTHFASIKSAREYLAQQESIYFDLVMLDEHLPDGRGLDLLRERWFEELAVLSVSSDTAPEIPGEALKAGAAYFLSKNHLSAPLFEPLVRGVIDRNRLQRELSKAKLDSAIIDTVKTLVATLRHEINNPLGAVLGAAYILRNNENANAEQIQAAELVESSGKRIKHVLDQLSQAMSIERVSKAHQSVFHIPGDSPWEAPHDKGDGKRKK